MKEKTYEQGVKDGIKLAKRKALEIVCDCEKITSHDYFEIRDAIKKIPETSA